MKETKVQIWEIIWIVQVIKWRYCIWLAYGDKIMKLETNNKF